MLEHKAEKRIDQYLNFLEGWCYLPLKDLQMGMAQSKPWHDETVHPGPFETISFPYFYGEEHTDFWFHGQVALPESNAPIFLLLDTETDTMVFINGKPQGATNPFHKKINVSQWKGTTVEVHLQAWAGLRFPGYHPSEKGRVQTSVAKIKEDYPLVFSQPKLLLRQEDVYQLYYDVYTLRQLSKTLDPQSLHYQHLISGLYRVLADLSLLSNPAERASQARKSLEPLCKMKNGTLMPTILCVGNSHLDHAWLWPIAETIRKAARTALNMTGYLQEYPEFRFMFSQPAQMKALKEQYPSVFEKIHHAFIDGRWEPNGICYIEPDCILPSGESLIRQNLWGRTLTAELFDGYRGNVFYLPDSFGFTPALPQILLGCGAEYFVTSKLSWNDTNRFPYDLFLWESLDGSAIKTMMIQGAYEGTADPIDMVNAYASILHKDLQPSLMRPIGEGDGGGGTLRSDLELIKRQTDLQGLPKSRWSTLSSAMKEVFTQREHLPSYRGELYLELHRGTYTNQARLKWWNRTLEVRLHNCEYLTSCLYAAGEDIALLQEAINAAWEIVLINQFHDILPGSSVACVNEEAQQTYEEANRILNEAFDHLKGPYLLNTNGFALELDDGGTLESFGTKQADPNPSIRPIRPIEVLDTEWATLKVDDHGRIRSLFLKDQGRELIPAGEFLNIVSIGEDYPVAWDAWDIERDSLQKQQPLPPPYELIFEESTDYYVVTSKTRISQTSTIEQKMKCLKKHRRITWESNVDWNERHQLLRTQFPLALSCDNAIYDVPFGHIQRSTHTNTSWERARFEVPAHRYAALRDEEIIVALMSDSKYGYSATKNELSLSLLRSSGAPDPNADKGSHQFTYGLAISTDGLGTIQSHAAMINSPPILVSSKFRFLVQTGCTQVIVETIKISEDGGSLVIRLRQWSGVEATISPTFDPSLDVSTLRLVTMIEEELPQIERFRFTPFEVKTYKITRMD